MSDFGRLAFVAFTSVALAGCSGGGGGSSRCDEGDPDCFLDALVADANGASIPLRTIDASLLLSTSGTGSPRSVWSIAGGGNGVDGWDGGTWDEADGSGDLLSSVWTATATDAWAVGSLQRIKHWDGASWSTASVGTSADLTFRSVWGSGPNDVYAGGTGGTVVHWDGSSWAPIDAGATTEVVAIAGSGPSDVWIGGGASLLRRWDGLSWTPVSPNTSIDISRMWVGSTTEAWAIGNGNVAVHWDGLSWATSTVPGATYLYDVWGSGVNDVWVIAYEITQGTFLLHWDGLAWSPEPAPVVMNEFVAIWGRNPNDIWLAGAGEMGHWNGSGWSVVPATPGLHIALHGLSPDPGTGNGIPPTITNQPAPMEFDGPSTRVDLPLDWTDPNGCTPAFCMTLCNPSLRCSTKARCSPLVRDGLQAGSTILALGYRTAVAEPQSFTLNVFPVSSPDCEDPLDRLVAGEPGVATNDPAEVTQLFVPAPSPTPTPTPGSHDGTWNLQVAIDSCYGFTHTVPITISGGAYSGALFQYCAEPVSGATRLGNNDCGADITQDVAVDLTVVGNTIEGNLTLTGGACNGANGFSGNFDSATTGAAASFWGTLTFTK